MTIRLGIIGFSEGNGHPYSWAAICNGYSPENMKACEFPVITQYLGEQRWPEARIPGVEVTHIWTQDTNLSCRIAKASLIANVAEHPTAMIGEIDALLLARDDAENHFKFAAPYIKAGIPVYIDKPIALSVAKLDSIYGLQQYDGQIFTCSALRYAKELMLDEGMYHKIGQIKHIQAATPKSWEKYAVHVIEPLLNIIGEQAEIESSNARRFGENGCAVSLHFKSGISADIAAFGYNVATPITIRVHGSYGWCDLIFNDSFSAFKSALTRFFEGIRNKACYSSYDFNRQVVSIIELGLFV